jgi:hypothetical protein
VSIQLAEPPDCLGCGIHGGRALADLGQANTELDKGAGDS